MTPAPPVNDDEIRGKVLKMNPQFMRLLRGARKLVFRTAHERMVAKWYEDDGENRLRFDYDLSSAALVFDLGGFEGRWASDIFGRFCCRVHVFEPVPLYRSEERRVV